MKTIRQNKITAALKNSGDTIWLKENNINYISNGHFLLELKKEMTPALMSNLVKLLGGIPENNTGLRLRAGHIINVLPEDMAKMISYMEAKNQELLIDTKLIHELNIDSKEIELKIFKNPDGAYIFLDKKYVDMVDLSTATISGTTDVGPVYLNGTIDRLMILPIRMSDMPAWLK